MAVFAPIPLPAANNPQFKDVMDYLENVRTRKAQQDLALQQLAETSQYHKGELGIRQQEADRMAKELPYLIQQYKDLHLQRQIENDPQAFANFMQRLNQVNSGAGNVETVPSVTNIPNISAPNLLGGSNAIPTSTNTDVGNTIPSTNATTSPQYNTLARMWMKKKFGIDPAQPLPLTPQQEVVQAGEKAYSTEQAKQKAKKEQEYLDTGDLVNKYVPNMKELHNLLNEHYFVSGNLPGLQNIFNLGTEAQGRFNSAAVPLVAPLAKDVSSKGGAVVARMMSVAKPNIWNSHATNIGLNNRLIEAAIQDFNQAKENYEQSTGKPYPKKLDPFLKQFENTSGYTRFLAPDGKTVIRIPNDKAEEFIKDHKDHTVIPNG